MNLLAQLKRRNVFRAAVLYAGAVWALAQGAAQLLPVFGAPDWVTRWFVIAGVIGFPFWIAFAWFYEFTPQGLQREGEIASDDSISRATGKRLDKAIIAVLAIAVVLLLANTFVSRKGAALKGGPAPAVTNRSIAVLPFVDMSQAHDQEYFSDGLSEELLNMLAQLPQLRVIARTSSFAFKGKDVGIAVIAKALQVANILEGSVRKDGNTLRISAQLVRASDSTQLWSNTYDRRLTDVFKVQDEIAGAVVDALKVKLLPAQQITNPYRSSNTEAYNLYLLGKEFDNRQNPDAWTKAMRAYHKAIALDPAYAAAYAGLASAEGQLGDATGDASLAVQAMADSQKAIDLAPGLADGFITSGTLRLVARDWVGAQTDLSKAVALNPADSRVQLGYARLMLTLGRLPDAIAAMRKSVELDPLSSNAWAWLGRSLNASGGFAAARKALERALEISSQSGFAQFHLGCNQLLQDRAQDALATFRNFDSGYGLTGTSMAEYSLGHEHESQQSLEEAIARFADNAAYQIAEAYAWRGEKGKAFQWLDRAYDQKDGGLTSIKADPLLKNLHDDPRYAALLKKMGLPE